MENVIDEKQEKEQEVRFHELNKKQDRTPDEEKELGKLKSDYAQSAKQRIDKITSERHKERIAREEAERKLQEMEERAAALEAKTKELEQAGRPKNLIQKDTVKIGEKNFYTDETLTDMINSGEINQTQAWQHQQQRLKAEAAEEAYIRIKSEEKQNEFKKVRDDDFDKVLKKYPQLNTKNEKYNPDDLLTKTVAKLWANGYSVNPDGLSRAVADAEEYVKLMKGTNVNLDISDDLSTVGNDGTRNERQESREKEVNLSDGEKEAAIRMYKDIKNPTTGRLYTEAEALEKAKRAKQARTK